MTDKAKYDAYTAGRECYVRGGRVSDCPFAISSPQYSIWIDGFTDAVAADVTTLGNIDSDMDNVHW